jgi:phytoene synthase
MADSDIDALVRRVDEDRWLASRFAPADVRAKLVAIYAIDYELSRIATMVREPAAGALRLAWWRDALEDVHARRGRPAQPTLQFYAEHCAEMDGATWQRVIEARAQDFEPVGTMPAFDSYAEAATGGALSLALQACGAAGDMEIVRPAARAWGYVTAFRTGRLIPRADVLKRPRSAYEEARAAAQTMPPQTFPACGFLAFVPMYLKSLARGRADIPLLRRQFKLIVASATGKF